LGDEGLVRASNINAHAYCFTLILIYFSSMMSDFDQPSNQNNLMNFFQN